MRILYSLLMVAISIAILIIAWPVFLFLFAVVFILFLWYYFKSKRIFKDAADDISKQWNYNSQNIKMDDIEKPQKQPDIIDVEFTERDVEDK